LQHEVLKHRLDAHLHLQTIPWNSCFADTPGRDILDSFLKKGSKSICNGTSPLDWYLVTALAKLYPLELIPYFGVHPWYVDALPENWLDNLKSNLLIFDSGIGEIGLDRSSSSKSTFSRQLDVFEVQLDLAVSLNLPVSIHCVRAWGILLDILQEKILIKIGKDKYSKIPVMIHAFSGSMEIMNNLTDMGVFLSFSPFLVSIREKYLREVLKFVPLEKILIESDFSYSKNIPIYNQISNYNSNLTNLYNIAGSLKKMDSEYFQEVIFKNGKIFTDRALNRH
jgi:TatD DNase family protein